MTVWWVNLGEAYRAQLDASALWCPNLTKTKSGDLKDAQWHWKTIQDVKAAEIIICCKKDYLMGIAVAQREAIENQPQLDKMNKDNRWHDIGWLLPVKFFESRLDRKAILGSLNLPQIKYGPFQKIEGHLTQTYLTRLPPSHSTPILEQIAKESSFEFESQIENSISSTSVDSQGPRTTEREQLSKARIGQGKFRKDLEAIWKGKCCTTGLSVSNLLRASHILPWKDGDNIQRLDPFNGLLLSAPFDAAFDKHLISLKDDGHWIISSQLPNTELEKAGLGTIRSHKVEGLTDKHKEYLEMHRNTFYLKQS